MSQPVEILLQNLKLLCEAFAKSSSPKVVYETQSWGVPFNTFKTVAPVMVATANALQQQQAAQQQEICQLRTELDHARLEAATFREETEKLCADLAELSTQVVSVIQEPVPSPKRFMGWNVQTGKDGYIRLYKKVAGKVVTLHVGKVWNEAKASEKVNATGLLV